jgi:hypothetical protein
VSDRNCIATFAEGDGHDRMLLGGKDANQCAKIQSGQGFAAGGSAGAQVAMRPRAARRIRRTLSARCRSGIMVACR